MEEGLVENGGCAAIARLIDHSLLHPAMGDAELEAGCRAAVGWGVACVCMKPYFVGRARRLLEESAVKAGTTVGFPHGGHAISVKVAEARSALSQGAQELDMVINVGKAKGGDWSYLEDEIGAVVEVGHQGDALVKVIFENCYLDEQEKRQLCRISRKVGADFIKTSTGYGTGGATDEDLRLMLEEVGVEMGVKAAGGVRTYAHVARLKEMGVRRIGASRTEQILEECRRESGEGGG
ncbi:MAG: deoxyribose-phosphate aldolase [Armatimonadota bacterium]|nr:MAG: deoxyribose-phosphate aldolase [Armatimonadota bacterium]